MRRLIIINTLLMLYMIHLLPTNQEQADYIRRRYDRKEVQESIKKEVKKEVKKQIKHDEITEEEMLIAYCVEAEASNQGALGKALVVDVILNRKESKDFPDSTYDVIYQKNAFEVVAKEMLYQKEPTEETLTIVQNEMEHRTNTEVLFFTAGRYNPYCTPLFKEGDHYFGY